MDLSLSDLAELTWLTAAYWLLDLAIRRDGWSKLFGSQARLPVFAQTMWCLPIFALASVWHWSHVPESFSVRLLSIVIAAGLCWKATTKDIDPVFADPCWAERITLPFLVAAIWLSPAFVLAVVYLLTHPFRLWEHHSTFPMRVLLAVAGYLACAGIALCIAPTLFRDSAVFFFFVTTIQISHYLITALAKAWLGPAPSSWVTDNRLHHLVATSYSWGWAKFLPWHVWRRVIGAVKLVEKPMQLAAFSLELFAPIAMVHPYAAIGFSLAWGGFHIGVFALSGLLFWDWTFANIAIAAAIFCLPASVAAHAYGWQSLIACFVFLVVFPLRHKLWKPMPLGWWDTPFTQRMHWIAVGESGTRYGVYNNFMCPNERLYGKLHACFLAPRKGITYHLGEVWKHDLRDAIRDAGPDLEKLQRVRDRYGVEPRDEQLASNHIAYLKRFFWEINEGARKWVFPRGLRWLKAPGDQVFYWGDLTSFSGQEKVRQIELVYREEYFDGQSLVRLTEEHVMTLDIDETCRDLACQPEPTPKQIDDLLLSVGIGKIIDLPSFADGFVKGDDGKPRE